MTIEPRKKPKQDRSHSMVERILGAARELLADDSTKGLTTSAIAERAGLSVGSLYQYFPNKEAIVLELARRWLAAFRPIPLAYATKDIPRTWTAFSREFRDFTQAIAAMYEKNRALLPTIEALQSHPELRRIAEEHDHAIIETHTAWLLRADPELGAATARRLGILLLETGHICFAVALTKEHSPYRLVVEDVIIMQEALLRAHLKMPE